MDAVSRIPHPLRRTPEHGPHEKRARHVAFSVAIRHVGAGSRVRSGIESRVLIAVPPSGRGDGPHAPSGASRRGACFSFPHFTRSPTETLSPFANRRSTLNVGSCR